MYLCTASILSTDVDQMGFGSNESAGALVEVRKYMKNVAERRCRNTGIVQEGSRVLARVLKLPSSR